MATTVEVPETADNDSPDYRNAAHRAQAEDLLLVRSAHGGTKTMRARGKEFLPQHPMESDRKYNDRLRQAVALNAMQKTVEGLVGMVFRRDPVFSEDMPPDIESHMESVDAHADALNIFMRRVAENALLDGHTWVHVEAPRQTPDVRSRLAEERAGIRPYWVNVLKGQAINWRYAMRGGLPVLTLFCYREGATEPAGLFGEVHRERIRVLRDDNGVIMGELWELQEDPNDRREKWAQVDAYRVDVPTIPVVFIPAYRTMEQGESDPPLRDLAYEQAEHYRVRSDRQKSLTFSCIAVPYLFGENVTDADGSPRVKWGVDGMLVVNDATAKAGVIESQGFGLEATKEELQEIEARMASMGLRMLVKRPNPSPQTATEQLLGKSQDDAGLVVFAKLLEDAANNILTYHGAYLRQPAPGSIAINRDFHTQIMDPGWMREIRELVANRWLSVETMWEMLVEGEVLTESFSAEGERARIVEDIAAEGLTFDAPGA